MYTKGVSTFEIIWIALNRVSLALEVDLLTDFLYPVFKALDWRKVHFLSGLRSSFEII